VHSRELRPLILQRTTHAAAFRALAAHQSSTRTWAATLPGEFENRPHWWARRSALEGRCSRPRALRSHPSAHRNGFVHNEAKSPTNRARFYAARGFQKFADAYLLMPGYCYQRWGADGKVAQLDQLYPLSKRNPDLTPTQHSLGTHGLWIWLRDLSLEAIRVRWYGKLSTISCEAAIGARWR